MKEVEFEIKRRGKETLFTHRNSKTWQKEKKEARETREYFLVQINLIF